MLFDINRVKENRIRSRESRSKSFLLKRVFGDLENRILDLPKGWECGLIEGCRKHDLKKLSKNNKLTISELSYNTAKTQSFDLYANLMQLHWSNDPYSDFFEKVKFLKSEGHFMCCLFGSETLNELRDSFFKAETKLFGAASPRISPLPEIRDVGNLATKIGLNNCVVDRDIIKVSYKNIIDLFLDIKEMGETNAILERRKSLTTKNLVQEVEKFYFKNFTDNGSKKDVYTINATFEIIFLYGRK